MDHEDLWRIAREGDQNARQELIETYASMARRVARRIRTSDPIADGDDIASVAVVGLIQAVDRYELERHVPFEAFAVRRIKGAILDEIRRNAFAGRAATDARPPAPISLDELNGGHHEPSDPDDEHRQVLEQDVRSDVRAAMDALAPRERTVVEDYYMRGCTLKEIARSLGVTEARICQLRSRAVAQLRAILVER
jgi:RNA polymerase sigma factor for flagellar operon FliA